MIDPTTTFNVQAWNNWSWKNSTLDTSSGYYLCKRGDIVENNALRLYFCDIITRYNLWLERYRHIESKKIDRNFNRIMNHPEFNKTIYLLKMCMKSTGVWPESVKSNYSWLKFFVSLFAMIFFVVIPQTTNLFFIENNLNDAIEILMISDIVFFITVCKLCNQLYKKRGNNL